MKHRLLTILLTVLTFVVLVPGQAQAYPNHGAVSFTVRADLSQSNMLASFQSPTQTAQVYVPEGAVYGESGTNLRAYEPLRLWTNGGWCSGWRYSKYHDVNQQVTYGPWNYVRGGSSGVSTLINPDGTSYEVFDADSVTVQAYLVPRGVAGCV
jgi:hypothetical protein